MIKSSDELRISIAGVEFKNPFILGSGPPTWNDEHIIKAAKLGWGGAVHKTFALEVTRDPTPRMFATKFLEDVVYVQNVELLSIYPKEQWAKWNRQIKSEAPADFVLISSIIGTGEPETWTEPLQIAQESGADMIEVNISCPNEPSDRGHGSAVGQVPDVIKNVVSYVKTMQRSQ